MATDAQWHRMTLWSLPFSYLVLCWCTLGIGCCCDGLVLPRKPITTASPGRDCVHAKLAPPCWWRQQGAVVSSVDNCICWAKPPPSAKFDLEAIEAFELDLLARERLLANGDDNSVDYDADDLDDDDDGGVNVKEYTIPSTLDKVRIDTAVAMLLATDVTQALNISRSACGQLVTDGQVRVNGIVETRKSFKVVADSTLHVHIPIHEAVTEIVPQNIPLDILFEDKYMLVLNKAAGMVVHPAVGHWDGTVVNALAYHLQGSTATNTNGCNTPIDGLDPAATHSPGDLERSLRPGIVHRLDKGTTGLLVVAKTSAALAALSDQFRARTIRKTYLAITVGNPGTGVVIDKPIGRHKTFRQRMRVVPDHGSNGRRAVSRVDTLAFDGKLAFARVQIETGRTHQIRVHLQDRRTPIYGDDVYGLADWNQRLERTHGIARPLLHAYQLQLSHPVTRETMMFRAPLPHDLQKIVQTIDPTITTANRKLSALLSESPDTIDPTITTTDLVNESTDTASA
jgi:23S rRNA pseudouridine1911/1915/1917 synthase